MQQHIIIILLRKVTNRLLHHPAFSMQRCISMWTSTVVVREHHLVPEGCKRRQCQLVPRRAQQRQERGIPSSGNLIIWQKVRVTYLCTNWWTVDSHCAGLLAIGECHLSPAALGIQLPEAAKQPLMAMTTVAVNSLSVCTEVSCSFFLSCIIHHVQLTGNLEHKIRQIYINYSSTKQLLTCYTYKLIKYKKVFTHIGPVNYYTCRGRCIKYILARKWLLEKI